MVYITLFAASFLAATLLPFGSEALYVYDISQKYPILFLWCFATMGNTMGSMANYWLGLKGEAYLERKGHVSVEKIENARRFFAKYGGWSLLLSWAPIVGDPLTFIAGVLRYNFKYFILIVFFAKGARYAIIGFLQVVCLYRNYQTV